MYVILCEQDGEEEVKMTGKEIVRELIRDPIEWLVEYGHDGADVLRCKFCLAEVYEHHHEEIEHEKSCSYIRALVWLKKVQ